MRAFFLWLVQEVNIFTWIVTISLDLLWNLLDGISIFSGVGIICYPILIAGIFTICFVSVTIIEHYLTGDEWKPALQKGAIFGVIAALPFSVISFVMGALGLIVKGTMGRDFTYSYGKLGLNYRELEKMIKRAAVSNGRLNGNWRDISMESAIIALERAGKLSGREARELQELRIARNTAYHEETPVNLFDWAEQAEQLVQKYQERFGAV